MAIILHADELHEREIQQAEWDHDPPHSRLSNLMRMQEITKFNNQMTEQYGHLRKETAA